MFGSCRLLALLVLVASVCSFASAQPRGVPSFTWLKYKGADGKEYDYPKWYAVDGGVSMTAGAAGEVGLPQGCELVTGTMRVEKPLGQGWIMAFEDTKVKITAAGRASYLVNGSDPTGPPKTVFPKGSDVRITWVLDYKDAQQTKTTVTFGPYPAKAEVK